MVLRRTLECAQEHREVLDTCSTPHMSPHHSPERIFCSLMRSFPVGGQSVPGTHQSLAFQEVGLKDVCFGSLRCEGDLLPGPE